MDQQTFNIKFQRIELLEKTMALNPGLKDGQQFNFNITAAPNIDLEKKLYVTFIKVNIMPIGSDLIMASVHVALGFEIEKFDEVFNTNEDGKRECKLNCVNS